MSFDMSLGDESHIDGGIMAKIETENPNHIILSDQETRRCRELLSDNERILLEIDPESPALSERRQRQQERVDMFRAALAPHKRIPLEILLEIFFFCLPDNLEPMYMVVETRIDPPYVTTPPTLSDAPWLLGQVCATWRNISRGEPRLWGRAIIDLDHELISPNLRRACEVLPAGVMCSVEYRSSSYDMIQPEFVQNLWRVQELYLAIPAAGYDRLWTILSPNSFATLQTAHFSIDYDDGEDAWTPRWEEAKPFQPASSLKKLLLASYSQDSPAALFLPLDIPWSQLITINLSRTPFEELPFQSIFQILQKCSSVENLAVSFGPDSLTASSEGSLVMPFLHSLLIFGILPPAVINENAFWNHLSMLNLWYAEFQDGITLYDILKQCNRLTKLATQVPPMATGHTIDGVLRCPDLVILNLPSVSDTWLFSSLETPSLTELRIAFPRLSESHIYPIRDMIVSNNCPLRVLWIGLSPEFKEEARRDASAFDDAYAAMPAVYDLFAAVPGVMELRITSCLSAQEKILEAIGAGSLFPRLTTFSCWPWPNSVEFCAEMVEKRVEQEFRQRRSLFRDIDVYSDWASAAAAAKLEAIRRAYGIQCRLVQPGYGDEPEKNVWDPVLAAPFFE